MPNVRIILGDNDRKFIYSATGILSQMGYDVIAADVSGTGLLRKIRSLSPDVVIVDVDLKGVSGFEISDIVEGEGICPCIITFKNNPMEYEIRLEQKRVYAYIQKPLNMDSIGYAIDRALLDFKEYLERDKRARERKVIEKAKLMLMEKYRMKEDKAYEYIRKKSMDRGTSMYKIALTIIDIINNKMIKKNN